MAEDFIEFTKDYSITNKRPDFDKGRGPSFPLPTRNQKKLSQGLSADALFMLGTGQKSGSAERALGGNQNAAIYQGAIEKFGLSTNGLQEALTAVKSGWSSGGMSGALGAIFGGGASSLLGPIAGGIGGMVSGYMNMRKEEKAHKIAQQKADATTLQVAKSPGGFRWDDPENTPDKYLDGTVTKGNFFNPGGMLGTRTT